MNIKIKSSIDGKTLFEGDYPDLRAAVIEAVKGDVYLVGADLSGADLMGLDLGDMRLRGADLRGADMRGTDLSWADLSGVDLSGAIGLPPVPTIPDLDAAILREIDAGRINFDMSTWHCGTTACRAGAAVIMAGPQGEALSIQFGIEAAAALIYAASRPGMRVPDFFCSTEEALADLRACAAAGPQEP